MSERKSLWFGRDDKEETWNFRSTFENDSKVPVTATEWRGVRKKKSDSTNCPVSLGGWGGGIKVLCRGRGWLDQQPQHRVHYNEPISAGCSEKSQARQCQCRMSSTTPRPMWTGKNQLGLDLCPERWKKKTETNTNSFPKKQKATAYHKGKRPTKSASPKNCQLR